MGHGRWSSSDWADYAARDAGRSREQIFGARGLHPDFDPARIVVRESRDGPENPRSTAIILASDVTGSMGLIAETMIRTGLDTTMRELLARKPVSDPHVMAMAIGDAYCDQAPLQATQFEADLTLADQLRRLWIEGGGGGNDGESYALAWLFAATRTSIDCFEKRGEKGYLFTIGDEPLLPKTPGAAIARIFGAPFAHDVGSPALLTQAQARYEVFHIVLADCGYASQRLDAVLASWRPTLGERVLVCEDHSKIAEVIVSAIEMTKGAAVADVAASWDDAGTARTVASALSAKTQRRGMLPWFGR